MYIRFNKELRRKIKELEKKIAVILDVDKAKLVVTSGAVNLCCDKGDKIEVCFETPVDDTYAAIYVEESSGPNLFDVLNKFMDNEDVEWIDRGYAISSEEAKDVLRNRRY